MKRYHIYSIHLHCIMKKSLSTCFKRLVLSFLVIFLSKTCNCQPESFTVDNVLWAKAVNGLCNIDYSDFDPDPVQDYVRDEQGSILSWANREEHIRRLMELDPAATQITTSTWSSNYPRISRTIRLLPWSKVINWNFLNFTSQAECEQRRYYQTSANGLRAITGQWVPSYTVYVKSVYCTAGTAPSGQECVECLAGKFAAEGSFTCTNCEAGTFAAAAGASACTNCAAGTFAAAAGATACTDCDPGKYS